MDRLSSAKFCSTLLLIAAFAWSSVAAENEAKDPKSLDKEARDPKLRK